MADTTGKSVKAPIAGTVHEIRVSTGSTVSAGDEVIVLEAMKMEIPIEAPMAATVAEVLVRVGQRVAEGESLLSLQ